MNLNEPTTPAAPVKACKNEPITRFRADDGKVYLKQFHNLRGVYDEELKWLGITTPDGTIAISSPGVWEVCEQLCAGRATMIRMDGKQITSVRFIPEEAEL
jgi:hypothetical protein